MRYFGIARKTAAILANLSLFLNSFLPFLIAIQPVYASDPEGAVPSIVENTPTPEPSNIVTPTPDKPTPTEPVLPLSPTPEISPTVAPTPLVTPENTPTITPTIEPTPESTPTTTPTDTPILSPTPSLDNQPANQENNQNDNSDPSPTAQPTPTPSVEPTPTVAPVIQQTCLTEVESIKDTTEFDWNYNSEKDLYETKEKVKLGVKYIFPQDNNVTVTFKCLPTNDSLLSTLKIKRVKTSDLNLPENTTNVGEYAYDITTDMMDGIFKYDITLPKTSDNNAGISYIEKSIDAAKLGVLDSEIKSVSDTEQQSDKVVGKEINHFTIFLVTANSTISNNSVGNPDKGWVSDNDYATFDYKNDYAEYGFPVISNPTTITPGSVINGIEVLVKGKTNIGKDFEVSIWNASNNTYTSSQKATMSTSDSTQTLGGSADLWGESWTVTDFSDANFKIKVDVNKDDGTAYLDHVEVKIYTTEPVVTVANPTLSNSCGLDVTLILDNSGSVGANLDDMKADFKSFVDTLANTPTQFSVVYFNDTAHVQQVFGVSASAIKTAIDNVPAASGSTNWQDGLLKAKLMTDPRPTVPNLVVFSSDGDPNKYYTNISNESSPTGLTGPGNGFDTASHNAAISVANAIKSSGTRIITLGIGIGSDMQSRMEAISSSDAYYNASNFSNLSTALNTIVNKLCGGSISVNKYIDSISESNKGGSGWTYTVSSGTTQVNLTSDSNGQANSGKVTTNTYSITETNILPGYSFGSAACKNQNNINVGSTITNGIGNISISDNDTISCDFINFLNKTDLSITKTDSPDPVNNNGTLTYTLTAKNETTVPAANVIVKDTLPTGFSITSVTPSVGNCSDKIGPDIQCELGTLTGNNSATVIIVGTVSTSNASISNTAVVSTTTPEISTSNNSDTEDTVVSQKGHLIVHKTTVPSGDSTVFTTNLLNSTGTIVDTGTVTDALDKNYEVVAGTYSVTETVPSGWTQTSNTCTNKVVAAGGTEECTITNTKYGSLTIVKNSTPDSSQSFSFTTSGTGLSNFSLTDDGNISNGSKTFTNLLPGTYSVTESATTGWDLTSATCTDNSSNTAINLSAGENITCTFTNTMRGVIGGQKYHDNDGNVMTSDDRTPVANWNVTLVNNDTGTNASTTTDQNGSYSFTNLIPGNYTLTEGSRSGWYNSSSQSLNVTLTPGQNNLGNDFINTQFASILVYKNVDTDGDGDIDETHSTTWKWNLIKDSNTEYSTGATVSNLYPGSYTISEQQRTGYHVTSLICNNGAASADRNYGATESQTITLSSGQNLVCTFTNTRDTGTLIVKKHVVNNNGGQKTASNFILNMGSTSFSGDENGTVFSLTPGNYSVGETLLPGYSQTENTCNITLGAGETETCTITNDDISPKLTLTKTVVNLGGGQAKVSDFTLKANDTSFISGVIQDINAGTYNLSETESADYNSSSWSCLGGSLLGSSITLTEGQSATCTITNTYIQRCGDGIKNNAEECDKNDLGGLPSSDFSCNASCKLELNTPKVTICHADNSQKKPYVTNTPDKSGDLDGHNGHNGGVWYPGIADHSWGDIIPPFYYIGGFYPGKNWTTEGKTIYNNGCQYPSGFINVVKVISNGATNYSDFSFSVNGESAVNFENDGSNLIDANVGVTYNIAETSVLGYEVSYNGCKNISVVKGETKTCIITNTKHAKLTIIKQVDTNNDGVIDNSNATDWTWDIANGDQNIATGQTKELAAGSYTISEDQKDAYRLKQWSCSNEANGTTNSIGVTLNPGDDVTCTITNTRKTGNIKVCKVILDSAGNIVNGSTVPTSTFTISGLDQSTSQGAPTGVIGTSIFTNPLIYSDKLFGSEVDNTTCTTYENLVPGNYYYGQESISNNYWAIPKYNDGVASQNNINDNFYEYSGQLFDADSTNDGQRQTSSDGHIVLEADQTRTLIVLNQYKFGNINVTKFNDKDGDGYQDEGESNLFGWTINLTGQTSVVTDANGLASFNKVSFGSYNLSETIQDGWRQTNIICDGDRNIDNDNSHEITLTAGQTLNCKIANQQLSNLTVYKFNDINGNGKKDEGESNLSDWMINLTGQTSLNTDIQGQVNFNNLVPGEYDLGENLSSQPGWHQTNIYCEDQVGGVRITKTGEAYGHHGNCEGWNGCKDAATCALWACHVRGYSNLVSYGNDKPCTDPSINNCHLFQWGMNYEPPVLSISSNYVDNQYVDYDWGTGCEVRGVTDIVCSNGNDSNSNQGSGSYSSGNHLTFTSGNNKICYIGNQRLTPKANISKSNNSGGSELSPGNSVDYTINIDVSDNNINNLKVTDLLSNGFKYRIGSYKVYKNDELQNSVVSEPQYHSPGVWDLTNLGELKPTDKIKLVYTADISTDQQAGKYADLAYASAVYGYDPNHSLLATANPEGYVDTNFVGTDVTVNRNSQNSVSAEVAQVNHVTSQVLGASTELPSTGAATLWLILSSILGAFGLILIKNDKISKTMAKKILSIFIMPLFTFLALAKIFTVQAAELSVRVEVPKTPTNTKDLQLKFVALDLSGSNNPIVAKCFKKGPTDSDFVQFGSDITLSAGGNASHCDLSSAITDTGSYQFKVSANGLFISNVVSLDYKNSTPDTPTDYRKEQTNNCDFKIHFKTGNDNGKTVKVELYRSTDSNFSANNESLVHSLNIGSNQESDILNNVPDCSKTYYFALRAFDDAGNGSGLTGDRVYTTITDTTTVNPTTTTNSGAIPVVGNNISPENPENLSTEQQSGDQSTGQILGSETKSGNFITRHKFISTVIGLALLAIIIYVFKKIRKGKKHSSKK